jgi:hypothetical protein
MIRVGDNISNPIEFVKANRQELQRTSQDGFVVVAGHDYDVAVSFYETEPTSKGATTQDCAIFGKLAPDVHVLGLDIGRVNTNLRWLNSAVRTTTIQKELGLEPGVDCLKFVNSEAGEIPTTDYVGYFSGGMYPRSCGHSYYFYHDRKQDEHNLGAMLMPELYVKNFALLALKKLGDNHKRSLKFFASDLDAATASATSCVIAATGKPNHEAAARNWDRARVLGGLGIVKNAEETMKQEFRKRVIEVLPKIEKMKKSAIDQWQYLQRIF